MAESAGDIVRIKLTQWAMGKPGRPPGSVLELPRHVAQMLVDQNKGHILDGVVQAAAEEKPRAKRIAGAPRNKSISAAGG